MDPSQAEQQEEVQPPEGDVPEELVENPSNTTHLDENLSNYRRLTDEYMDFLKRTRTFDCQKDSCNLSFDIRLSKVDLATETLNEHRLALTKARSTTTKTCKGKKTSHSGSSNVSDMSSLAQRKRAKAEAAKSK